MKVPMSPLMKMLLSNKDTKPKVRDLLIYNKPIYIQKDDSTVYKITKREL